MAFQQMDTFMARPDAGRLRGERRPVACKVWCTKSGELMPLSFKFEQQDGSLCHVTNICTELVEEKYYSGIRSREFTCRAEIGNIIRKFKLIFYVESCRWVMVV